jgi:S-adenosylmethionine/arginine decarboxylase-like enzyme
MIKKTFGYELIMDLYGCDKNIISSKKKLQTYVNKLCRLIKMKKYGKTHLPYFGEKQAFTKGYSLVQLIETSSITGHFSDYWQTAYINIFSCKKYSQAKAKNFTAQYFKAKRIKARLLIR